MTTEVRPVHALPKYVREGIALGASRIRCPVCEGGKSRELSLSISQTPDTIGLLRLHCWRDSCGWYCITLLDDAALIKYEGRKLQQGQAYKGCTMKVLRNMACEINRRWNILPSAYRGRWFQSADVTDELVMSIRNRSGHELGHITRTVAPKGEKVVRTYKTTAQPFLDWWLPTQSSKKFPLIIVEDSISAAIIASYHQCPALALLGTGMSVADAVSIRDEAKRLLTHDGRFLLALDPDAFETAKKLSNRHQGILELVPVFMDSDFKDLSNEDRRKFIKRMTDG